jgi:hypothetical protein
MWLLIFYTTLSLDLKLAGKRSQSPFERRVLTDISLLSDGIARKGLIRKAGLIVPTDQEPNEQMPSTRSFKPKTLFARVSPRLC